jgi:hypothetical protein
MEREVEPRVIVGKPREPHAHERATRQVERPQQVFGREAHGLSLALVGRKMAQIHERQVDHRRWLYALPESTGLADEDGAPGFVTREQIAERLGQAGPVQHAAVADRDLLVVERHVGRELRMQPDLLLGEGQGAGVEPAARDDDRRRAGGARRRSADGRLVPHKRARHRAHAEPLLTVTGSRSRPRSARFCRQTSGPGSSSMREKR